MINTRTFPVVSGRAAMLKFSRLKQAKSLPLITLDVLCKYFKLTGGIEEENDNL